MAPKVKTGKASGHAKTVAVASSKKAATTASITASYGNGRRVVRGGTRTALLSIALEAALSTSLPIGVLIDIITTYAASGTLMLIVGGSDTARTSITTIRVMHPSSDDIQAELDRRSVSSYWSTQKASSSTTSFMTLDDIPRSSDVPITAIPSQLKFDTWQIMQKRGKGTDGKPDVYSNIYDDFASLPLSSVTTPKISPMRYTATAALLNQHYLYVAGGWSVDNVPKILDTTVRYSLLDGTETQVASMTRARRGCVSAVADHKWIVTGGAAPLAEAQQTADADTSSEWYSAERDEWYTGDIPHTSVGHACGGAVVLSGRMCAFGGLAWDVVESWDPRANEKSWVKHASMPIINHYGFGLVNVNEYTALVLGGYTLENSQPMTDKAYIFSFDMRMNRWHTAHTQMATRSSPTLATPDNNSSSTIASHATADWPPLPVGLCYITARFIDDHIIIAGGSSQQTNASSVYVLRTTSNGFPIPGEPWRRIGSGGDSEVLTNTFGGINTRSGSISICV